MYDEALKQVDEHIGETLLSRYDLGSTSTLTEVLFMERCLRLLKRGGRMGMVLPEGVLNNKNLAAVREYFESKAKLILICSIPQDVFIAAGATVKPSLVFMRKFTAEEEAEYAKCRKEAIADVTAVHQSEINSLNIAIADCSRIMESLKNDLKSARDQLKQLRREGKDLNDIKAEIESLLQKQSTHNTNKKNAEKALKELYKQIESEAKPVVKKKFDYDIPIAKVEDAGITSTGAVSEGNQLPGLVEEYHNYSKEYSLWDSVEKNYSYELTENGVYCCFVNGEEVRLL